MGAPPRWEDRACSLPGAEASTLDPFAPRRRAPSLQVFRWIVAGAVAAIPAFCLSFYAQGPAYIGPTLGRLVLALGPLAFLVATLQS